MDKVHLSVVPSSIDSVLGWGVEVERMRIVGFSCSGICSGHHASICIKTGRLLPVSCLFVIFVGIGHFHIRRVASHGEAQLFTLGGGVSQVNGALLFKASVSTDIGLACNNHILPVCAALGVVVNTRHAACVG